MVRRVTLIVTAKTILLLKLRKRKALLSVFELNSAYLNNCVLAILCSGKETEVTQTYGKKAEKGNSKSGKAAKELTGSLIVFLPINVFKLAISKCSVSSKKFFKDLYIKIC